MTMCDILSKNLNCLCHQLSDIHCKMIKLLVFLSRTLFNKQQKNNPFYLQSFIHFEKVTYFFPIFLYIIYNIFNIESLISSFLPFLKATNIPEKCFTGIFHESFYFCAKRLIKNKSDDLDPYPYYN